MSGAARLEQPMPKVIVEARPQGFWSAGRFWHGGKNAEAEVTEKQLAELKSEPVHFLVAREVKAEEPAPQPQVQPQPAQPPPQPQQQKRR